jgi:AcrR family transcriptional regulator
LADITSDAAKEAATMPRAWQERAVSRSFERFRARAERQSARFIEAALELLEETGGEDFTVQDVVERMKVSTKTFYQFFSGKDEFLVAMSEEIQRGRHKRLRQLVDAEPDPLGRLRAFVVGTQQGTEHSVVGRFLVQQYFRLQVSHPAELRQSNTGTIAYLAQLVADAAASGHVRSEDHHRTAGFILQTMYTAMQGNILGSPLMDPPPSPEEVWEFSLQGIRAGG